MNVLRTGTLALFAILGMACVALAEAESGFGIYGGYANHRSKGQFTEAPFAGQEFEFRSQGLSYGIDYQFALGDSFSISPFLMSSFEEFNEESDFFSSLGIDTGSGSHTILGVQLRYWMGELFVGGHAGLYTEVFNLEASNGNTDDGGFGGTGGGGVVGWETDSGLFFLGQIDFAKLKGGQEDESDIESETDLTGLRLHAGYRFK